MGKVRNTKNENILVCLKVIGDELPESDNIGVCSLCGDAIFIEDPTKRATKICFACAQNIVDEVKDTRMANVAM